MNKSMSLCLMAILVTGTAAYGNAIERPTYTKDIAPIMNNNCVECHRPGQIGPMSLLSYKEVRPWAKSIGKNVGDKSMPPWDGDHGFGPFMNDTSLSEDEIQTVINWVKQGAKEGSKKDLPPTPTFSDSEWKLGEPDYIVTFDPFDVPAGGSDLFHDFFVTVDIPEDKWISKVEVLPGSSEVVHHVILWQGNTNPNATEGWIGAWAAGAIPMEFPEGTGRLLKKEAVIRGDMHYHPTDRAITDQTRLGFHFADAKDIEKELINLWVINATFEIPAGAPNHEVRSSFTFPQDSHISSLTPHMHYRGKDFKYTLTYPNGESKDLLKVSDYDFAWQTEYKFEEHIAVPKGSRIDCVAHYDNSEGNLDNPDPTKNIFFGVESYDEMMIGFIDYYVDEGMRPKPVKFTSPLDAKMGELTTNYPGEIYTIRIPVTPGQPPQQSALYIPKEGEGGWFVELGSNVVRARIFDITWIGSQFEATVFIPGQGNMSMKGSLDDAAGVLSLTMSDDKGNSNDMRAMRAQ